VTFLCRSKIVLVRQVIAYLVQTTMPTWKNIQDLVIVEVTINTGSIKYPDHGFSVYKVFFLFVLYVSDPLCDPSVLW